MPSILERSPFGQKRLRGRKEATDLVGVFAQPRHAKNLESIENQYSSTGRKRPESFAIELHGAGISIPPIGAPKRSELSSPSRTQATRNAEKFGIEPPMLRQFRGGSRFGQRIGGQATLVKNRKMARLIEQPPISDCGSKLACRCVHMGAREQPVSKASTAVDVDPKRAHVHSNSSTCTSSEQAVACRCGKRRCSRVASSIGRRRVVIELVCRLHNDLRRAARRCQSVGSFHRSHPRPFRGNDAPETLRYGNCSNCPMGVDGGHFREKQS